MDLLWLKAEALLISDDLRLPASNEKFAREIDWKTKFQDYKKLWNSRRSTYLANETNGVMAKL